VSACFIICGVDFCYQCFLLWVADKVASHYPLIVCIDSRVLERAAAAAKKQEKLDKKERAVTSELFEHIAFSISLFFFASEFVNCSACFPAIGVRPLNPLLTTCSAN
jgi:hypothetical protein